jgi:hypothetical protein
MTGVLPSTTRLGFAMTMRKRYFGAAVALALWLLWAAAPVAAQVAAQDPNQLAQLKISIWPEYDRPNVLVLLDGTLAERTNLPRQVAVLIPSGAELSVTTWQNPDGTFAPEQPSQSTDLGDGYTRVTFTITQSSYRVEYYADLLKGAPAKTMDFVFKSQAAIAQATLEVQQPPQSTNFSITPPAQTFRTDPDGFKYFSSQFANLAAGQLVTAQVRYSKADANPSVPPSALANPPANASAPASNSSTNVFFLIALVVLGLTAVLGFLVWQRRNVSAAPAQTRPNARGKRRGSVRDGVFCPQCGHGLGAEDNFCPKCGTKRRETG